MDGSSSALSHVCSAGAAPLTPRVPPNMPVIKLADMMTVMKRSVDSYAGLRGRRRHAGVSVASISSWDEPSRFALDLTTDTFSGRCLSLALHRARGIRKGAPNAVGGNCACMYLQTYTQPINQLLCSPTSEYIYLQQALCSICLRPWSPS